MPQSKFTGPSPLPMATMVSTPASRARAITSSRSASKRWPSRWAWESMNIVARQSADGWWSLADGRSCWSLRPSNRSRDMLSCSLSNSGAMRPEAADFSSCKAALCYFASDQQPPAISRPYFSLAPTGTSSKNPASTGCPPSSDAATIMPFDSRPRSLRGARFATITTLRPTSVSGA